MCIASNDQAPSYSVFTPVELIFDAEPYDVDIDPANEEQELPFCDQIASISMIIQHDDLDRLDDNYEDEEYPHG